MPLGLQEFQPEVEEVLQVREAEGPAPWQGLVSGPEQAWEAAWEAALQAALVVKPSWDVDVAYEASMPNTVWRLL